VSESGSAAPEWGSYSDTMLPGRSTTGDRIRAFRKLHHWTQEQFGARVGASKTTVCSWERGESRPSARAGKVLARLGVKLEAHELSTGRGPCSNSARTRSSRLAEVRRHLRSDLVTEEKLAAVEVALGIGGAA
jgi:transcriptional regulator with XRE-family HTH domain